MDYSDPEVMISRTKIYLDNGNPERMMGHRTQDTGHRTQDTRHKIQDLFVIQQPIWNDTWDTAVKLLSRNEVWIEVLSKKG